MLLPGIDSIGVVLVDAACVAMRVWATVSARSSASRGSSGQGPLLVGLISDEADVNSALRGLELIYVPYRAKITHGKG